MKAVGVGRGDPRGTGSRRRGRQDGPRAWRRPLVGAVLTVASAGWIGAPGPAGPDPAGQEVTAVPIQGAVTWRGRPAESAILEFLPVDGSASRTQGDTVLIDQRHLRFVPGVLGIQAGTTVEFRNSDEIMHNVFSPERRGADFDLGTYPEGESRTHTFENQGSYVILCHVHPEMAAWIVVSESPWVVVTEEDGSFELPDLPPGEYDVVGWYRRRIVHQERVRIAEDQGTIRVEMGR